jgi:hypothetical protein
MAQSQRKSVFGIHEITAYDRNTRLPIGNAKVLGAVNIAASAEQVELLGGSNPFAWETEAGQATLDLTVTVREFPDWFYDVLMGKAATVNAAEASGSTSALTNAFGTSVLDATTGIASIAVKSGSEADLKTGTFIVKADSATTVRVFALTSADFKNGTDLDYVDDTLEVTSSALTITAAGDVDIPALGVTLTGGSGTIGMTEGDTAIFSTRAINAGSLEVTVGGQGDVAEAVGLFVTAQKKGTNETFMIDVFKAKGFGFPINMTEKAFAESEIVLKGAYDSDRDGVFKVTRVDQ